MSMAHTLPPSHPLINELTSLRQQLLQYQKAAHQSAIQLQGTRLELNLAQERLAGLEGIERGLKAEVEVLRAHPAPPPIPPSSTALTELSLAHRRLSAKLDLTEQQLNAVTLELAASKQEVGRLVKEREGDRAVINELRRVEDDREEEIEWERGERRKAEEQKKLCDLALQEYSTLVHSLDPSAVPPPTPSSSTSNNILHPTPELLSTSTSTSTSTNTSLGSPTSTVLSTSDSISNLIIGQKGVHQLFNDFTSTLTGKEKALHSAHSKIEELEHTLQTVKDQLEAETALRVNAQNDRDRALRDDGSAAKVVERYMTFTQKTHATVHLHLNNLRARSKATQTTLRNQIASLTTQLNAERNRANKLRDALDEMSEGMTRETAGRRREVALRLKMIANEEKRERKVEIWLDRVRRTREGAEGAVVEPDILESMLDEGVEAVTEHQQKQVEKRSWRGFLGNKKKAAAAEVAKADGSSQEESIARVLLAEELVDTLVRDLQSETERRMQLEKERVEWLAKEAEEGVKPEYQDGEDGDGHLMFEAEDHDETPNGDDHGDGDEDGHGEDAERVPAGSLAPPDIPRTPSPLPETPPLLPQLRDLFDPLTARYEPVQKTLHDLAHSLTSLRSIAESLSSSGPSTSSSSAVPPRKPLLNLSRKRNATVLNTLLESLHEVIEDARVDVEIALADEERVYRGFEALLGVGKGGAVQGGQVLKDAREYVADRTDWEGFEKLKRRVGEIELDLTDIKRVIHEKEGLEVEGDDTTTLGSLDLRTVTVPSPRPLLGSPTMLSPLSPDLDGRKRSSNIISSVGNVGRSFSASVIGAPRRVGSFAGGLYRPKGRDGGEGAVGKEGEEEGLIGNDGGGSRRASEDDVE